MSNVDLFLAARERFFKRTLLSSGLSLLLAGGSRLPTWEVASPVQWLLGTVNVGFLPIFGPIIVFGTYCFMILGLSEVVTMQHELAADRTLNPVEAAGVHHSGFGVHYALPGREIIAIYALRFWIFLVPLIAYAILVTSYFDFVRPMKEHGTEMRFTDRGDQIADLLAGIGGWGSFKPLTPSISDNLNRRAETADKKEEQERIRSVAATIPYIHAPLQTWGYLLGFIFMIWMGGEEFLGRIWRSLRDALRARQTGRRARGTDSPATAADGAE